jgi:hypothetical protein
VRILARVVFPFLFGLSDADLVGTSTRALLVQELLILFHPLVCHCPWVFAFFLAGRGYSTSGRLKSIQPLF